MVTRAKTAERESQAAKRSFARKMRSDPGYVEKVFWNEVRDRKLAGFKFKRQHPIPNYIVDFVCIERKLIIELDGGIHKLKAENDAIRDAVLQTQGYRVLRFTNEEALIELPAVLKTIRHALGRTTPSPLPSPPEGERVIEMEAPK